MCVREKEQLFANFSVGKTDAARVAGLAVRGDPQRTLGGKFFGVKVSEVGEVLGGKANQLERGHGGLQTQTGR